VERRADEREESKSSKYPETTEELCHHSILDGEEAAADESCATPAFCYC
jgi:hypothetical protein